MHTALLRVMLFTCLLPVSAIAIADGNDFMKPIAFNDAEAIIEAFWQPEISGFDAWEIDDGTAHRLQIFQNWAAVDFQWQSRPDSGPALRMRRAFAIDCSGHDRLLLAMTPPKGAIIRIQAETDAGPRNFVSEAAGGSAVEYPLNLEGATRILAIVIEIEDREEGPSAGWFKWIALQNTRLLERYQQRWDRSEFRWDAHLIPEEEFTPEYKPRYGIFLDEAELDALREEHVRYLAETNESPFLQSAEALRDYRPEPGIGEFANSGGRRNYPDGRVRDAAHPSISGGLQAARLGLVLKDPALLRVAARCALSLAISEHWHEGFTANFPGSSWELRSFRRSYVSQDIAMIMDLAGEIFTEEGRRFLLRRLSEEGVGPINYVVWRYDYVSKCNQLSYFSLGRIAAYLVLEREWPRVQPYTTLAATELQQLFHNLIMADGGFMEPPTYFQGTFNLACESLEYYARGRGLTPAQVIPESLRRTGDYAATIASTRPETDVIPLGDSGETFSGAFLLRMARVCPESYWLSMFRKRVDPVTLPAAENRTAQELPSEGPALPAFVFLPDTGHMASTRPLYGHLVKLFIPGNKGDGPHSHEHEDKGSFVLEFAGEAFAMDPGIGSYRDPLHNLRKQCEHHNMLVPTGTPERPHPLSTIPMDVKPEGQGDETSFHARMDLAPGWEDYYEKWVRTWDSPEPGCLTIRDEYALRQGDGVVFYWQTPLPCEIDGQTITLRGARGSAVITAPENTEIRLDTFQESIESPAQNRIAIQKTGRSSTLEVKVKLVSYEVSK